MAEPDEPSSPATDEPGRTSTPEAGSTSTVDPPQATQATDEPPPTSTPALAYRPPFARAYPRDPELDRLLAAFLDGNNALVFEGAPLLAERTDDPAVARAARDLHRRLQPDPLALAMLGGTGGLLLLLILWFYSHRHGH